MAELLGLVVSGVSVAQIAGSIVTTSLKVKGLLEEVKEAPESLKAMLDYIEILTPILYEATAGGDDDASTIPLTLPAKSHLRQALTACQKAGEQLEVLAGDLMDQINAARGGVRRKRAMVKVVLKRGTLAQHEARLQRAIWLLQVAQGAYTNVLLRTQPETIVSQLVPAPAQPHQLLHGPDQSPPQFHSPPTTTGRRIRIRRNARAFHECLQFGFANITGLVRIHTSSGGGDYPTPTSARNRVLRVQFQMPAWLCATVIDAAFSRSYGSWYCSLNTYGYLVQGSVQFEVTADAIRDDDVDAIHRLFQERRCRPLDHIVWKTGREENLLEYALHCGAWQASGYLLSCGAAQPDCVVVEWARGSSENSKHDVEALIRHHELNDYIQMHCLVSICEDLDSFTDQVGRLWPYNEFYSEALEFDRLALAAMLAAPRDETWVPPSDIFQHLCESALLAGAGSITTTEVLSCIAWALGNIVWRGPDVVAKWYSATRDTALRLDKSLMMPEQQLHGYGIFDIVYLKLFPKSTPFTDMFMPSMITVPVIHMDPKDARQQKLGSRLAKCERAVQMWLNILKECGIDLIEYGRQELQRLKDQKIGWEFRIYRDVQHDRSYLQTKNGSFEVRLIGFKYGSEPGDWKLWWSEPTDSLVGDFWKEVEPEPLCMPGSWDEDL